VRTADVRPAAGPGPITADGCPVDLYARLPACGEAHLVHAAAAPGASILDLGCGTGRVTHGLITLGHPVVAVDQSAEMLAHVRGAETVCAPIAGLDLDRRFGAVLLASHLINTANAPDRRALLATGRAAPVPARPFDRRVAPAGVVRRRGRRPDRPPR
jgi:SAM-dependent methyltransferase